MRAQAWEGRDVVESDRDPTRERGPWHYPAELADALARFGLAPSSHNAPTMVRDALNGLYRYELRRLRDRLIARQIEKPDYIEHVIGLRKKYWPLSLLPAAWERICREGA